MLDDLTFKNPGTEDEMRQPVRTQGFHPDNNKKTEKTEIIQLCSTQATEQHSSQETEQQETEQDASGVKQNTENQLEQHEERSASPPIDALFDIDFEKDEKLFDISDLDFCQSV
jgi:hypothetical protein